MHTTTRTVKTIWEVWSYDVWGNAEDGYEVNNRFCDHREYPIDAPVTDYNMGTPHAFSAAFPSDEQIKEALRIQPYETIDTDGDDMHIYVTDETGFPLGEMLCVSHESLSPIQYKS